MTFVPDVARCVTTRTERLDGETETFVARPLRASHNPTADIGTPLVVNARQDPDHAVDVSMPLDTDGTSLAVAFDLNQVTSPTHRRTLEPRAGALSVAGPMGVRRLTPRECERLQGFPDDYTAVTYRGKPAADGPRYTVLGNSMAVPVVRWIGERLAAADALLAGA